MINFYFLIPELHVNFLGCTQSALAITGLSEQIVMATEHTENTTDSFLHDAKTKLPKTDTHDIPLSASLSRCFRDGSV